MTSASSAIVVLVSGVDFESDPSGLMVTTEVFSEERPELLGED